MQISVPEERQDLRKKIEQYMKYAEQIATIGNQKRTTGHEDVIKPGIDLVAMVDSTKPTPDMAHTWLEDITVLGDKVTLRYAVGCSQSNALGEYSTREDFAMGDLQAFEDKLDRELIVLAMVYPQNKHSSRLNYR